MRKESMRPQVSCQATASDGKPFRRYLCAGLSQPHPRFGHPRRRPRLLKGFVVARASCAWDPRARRPCHLKILSEISPAICLRWLAMNASNY